MSILLIFFVYPNIILGIFERLGARKYIRNSLLLVISYGVGPFIISLFFYSLIFLFPERSDFWYGIFLCIPVLAAIFLLNFNNITQILKIYKDVSNSLRLYLNKEIIIFLCICGIFFSAYAVQLFVIPIADNDSALYLNQSAAVYKYKNIDWQKKDGVYINDNDFYKYNYSIRPGITMLQATLYIIDGSVLHKFFYFQFTIFFYFLLLLGLFLITIRYLEKSDKLFLIAATYGLLFFIFSWGLTRMFIYSAKEILIYFFALLSLVLADIIIKQKEQKIFLCTIISIILGINAFINAHGFIIECIIILIIFLFSKKNLLNKLIEIALILVMSIFFGGFEILLFAPFVFWGSFVNSQFLNQFTSGVPSTNLNSANVLVEKSTFSMKKVLDFSHETLYQISGWKDVYLKGKLQILTNVGVFGIYFWIFIFTLAKFFIRIFYSNLLKIVVIFIGIYYFIVIDPFALNSHPLAIVLWGSSKYVMLLMFLGIIVVSVFMNDLILWLGEFLEKNKNRILFLVGLLMAVIVFMRVDAINIATKVLLSVISMHEDISFYRGKIENFFIILFFILFIIEVVLIFSNYVKTKKLFLYLGNFLLITGIVVPFFITNVGKVSLLDSFSYFNKDEKYKLEHTLNEEDVFNAYFKAKKILPKNTALATNFYEIYPHDDYFSLVYADIPNNAHYKLSNNCENWKIIYTSGNVNICEAESL